MRLSFDAPHLATPRMRSAAPDQRSFDADAWAAHPDDGYFALKTEMHRRL
ncbi:MAG: hypothetical protein JWO88_3973, partial [Frankiales bacterium]|nr:hypothetical protein [Frankiales bacterium]